MQDTASKTIEQQLFLAKSFPPLDVCISTVFLLFSPTPLFPKSRGAGESLRSSDDQHLALSDTIRNDRAGFVLNTAESNKLSALIGKAARTERDGVTPVDKYSCWNVVNTESRRKI